MAGTFRPRDVDPVGLFPPGLSDFVPEGHPAHFVKKLVREDLDLSAILDTYSEERGYPPHHPAMMTALLPYGYSRRVTSSRKLEQACIEGDHRCGQAEARGSGRDGPGAQAAAAADRGDVGGTAAGGMEEPPSAAGTSGRAGLRADQGGERLPEIPAPRTREGPRGAEPPLHGAQRAAARRRAIGHPAGLPRRREEGDRSSPVSLFPAQPRRQARKARGGIAATGC